MVGVYGTTSETLVLPTVWGNAGLIQPGASPAEASQPPSPSVYQQLLTNIGDLENLDTNDKSSLVAAINEIYQAGGGGGVTIVDLGAVTSGRPVTITSEQMALLLGEFPPVVVCTIENVHVNLYRYDMVSNEVYFSNVMYQQGLKHFVSMTASGTTATVTSTEENQIPPVTAEDDGKVLGVVNGEWSVVEPSGFKKVIDLASTGVVIDAYTETVVTIPESTGLQLQQAALAGGAVVQIGFNISGDPVPVQAFCSGSAITTAKAYQLVCKVLLDTWIEISFILNNSTTELAVKSNPVYVLPEPIDGAYLKATGNEWYATIVPDAEGASF